MKQKSYPILSFRFAAWLSVFILAADIAVITLAKDERQRMVFSDLITPLTNLMAAAGLFYAARISARNGSRFSRSWYLWTVGLLIYATGSIVWAVYELVLGEPAFPSLADLFYISFYVFIWVGLAQYPVDENQKTERKLALLDNLIVMLGAGLSFWVFLIKPFIVKDGFTLTTFLELAYPVLDMISVWTLMIFFRARVMQSEYIPLLMIGFGFLSEVTADVLFTYQSLHATYLSGNWDDLFFLGSSLAFMLAAIRHVDSLALKPENSPHTTEAALSRPFSNQWPVYLPYFWLAVAYGVLIHCFAVQDIELSLFLIIGLIIGLVILRQMLTLNDNQRLFYKAQAELEERKQVQQELRQANLELDARVEQRTNDLHIANDLLVQYNQKIELSLHEKEVLLKEIHHRVKNNLQIVSSLLNIQAHTIKDPEALTALQSSQSRVRSMALIHERLYQSQNMGRINFGRYIKDLAAFLFRTYQDQSGRVQLTTCLDDVELDIDTAVPLGLILNELITNALKYAFPVDRTGEIAIQLLRHPDGFITLVCADTGGGLPPGQDLLACKSLGIELVRNLTSQLEGEVEAKSHNGLQVRIKIPYGEKPALREPLPTQNTPQGAKA